MTDPEGRRTDDERDDVLGPCGCIDYHTADCPTRVLA